MSYLIIFAAGMASAWLFAVLPVRPRLIAMPGCMTEALAILQSDELTDDQKQKRLLLLSGKLLTSTLFIAAMMSVTVLPFVFIAVVEHWLGVNKSVSDRLLTLPGIVVCVLGFASCYLLKKIYERPRV